MQCIKCGFELEDGDIFCGNCGENIEKMNEEKRIKLEKKQRTREERNAAIEKRIAILEESMQEDEAQLKEKGNSTEDNFKQEVYEDAENFIIESEGNKFKAIKMLKEKWNLNNEVAKKYVNYAFNNFQNTDLVENDSSSDEKNISDTLLEQQELVDDPTKIKKTIIVATDSRKKVTSAVGRGVVGGVVLGPVGLLAGITAKSKHTTTFQIIYMNGEQTTETVKNDSQKFKLYCKYLDNN